MKLRNKNNKFPIANLPSAMQALEPRVMLDAALATAVDDGVQQQEGGVPTDTSESVPLASNNAQEGIQDDGIVSANEVVFIDSRVEGSEGLLKDVDPNAVIMYLDANEDGLHQINEFLASVSNQISALHIVSHGSEGQLILGNSLLNQTTMESLYAQELNALGSYLSPNADILIYGCDFAGGQLGQSAVASLASLTGSDVAASIDDTGSAALGGNWTLETSYGSIQTASIVATDWDGLLAPVPTTSINNLPSVELIDSGFSFNASFSNSSAINTDLGYLPYVDVIVGSGINITSADYFGFNLSSVDTFYWTGTEWNDAADGTGNAVTDHPLTSLVLTNGAVIGDIYNIYELPNSSFAPQQDAVAVSINANFNTSPALGDGAEFGVAQGVKAIPGFVSATDDGVGTPIVGSEVTSTITPFDIIVTKTNNAPSGERVTGPNFPITYSISVDIATGSSKDDIIIEDFFNSDLTYVTGTLSQSPVASTFFTPDEFGQPGNPLVTPGFYFDYGTVVGGAGVEIQISYDAYINDIINSTDGFSNKSVQNTVDVTFADPVNIGSTITVSETSSVTAKAIQVRKGSSLFTDNDGSGNFTPEDIVRYRYNIDFSDYLSFDDVVFVDVLDDGLLYDASLQPTYTVSTLPNGNITPVVVGQMLTFDLSAVTGVIGNEASTASANTATITYFAEILQIYPAGPNAGEFVTTDDVLSNSVTMTASANDGTSTSSVSDADNASVTISGTTFVKNIYAINGSTSFDLTNGLTAGDTVTYNILFTAGAADFQNLIFRDFNPDPIYDISSMSTTFNTTIDATAPALNTAKFGPTHNLDQVTFTVPPSDPPVVTVDAASNAVDFTFGDMDQASFNGNVVISILYTLELQDTSFPDNKVIVNQASARFNNVENAANSSVTVSPVLLKQADLSIVKGITASSSGTLEDLIDTGVYDRVVDVDGGDQVTFEIRITNDGGAAAYDVIIEDTLPSGLTNTNITSIVRGDGVNFTGFTGDLFAGGLSFSGTSGTGGVVLEDSDSVTGADTMTITFTADVTDTVNANSLETNTSVITQFKTLEAGLNQAVGNPDKFTDTADVQVDAPTVSKSIEATDQSFTTGTNVAIGEVITYNILYTFTEGTTPNVQLIDRLPNGLEFVTGSEVLITTAAGSPLLTQDYAGNITSIDSVTVNGNDVIFNTNITDAITTADNNVNNNSIVIQLDARVRDIASNEGQTTSEQTRLNNRGRIVFDDDGGTTTINSSNAQVRVVEPLIEVTKEFDQDIAEGGDDIGITLTLENTGLTNAYDVQFTDTFSNTEYSSVVIDTYDTAFFDGVVNVVPGGFEVVFTSKTPSASFAFEPSDSYTFTLDVTLASNVPIGSTLSNTATSTVTSLPDAAIGERTTTDSGTDTIDISPDLSKEIISTSEAHTTEVGGLEQLAIGEIARYRLTIGLPEGTGINTKIQELLPDGLTFINDNTAKIAFVSDNSGLTSSTISDPSAYITGDETTVDSITPVYSLFDAAISSSETINDDNYGSGVDVFFKLGDVVNAEADANSEYIIIEFNALVNNITTNQAGTTLTNQYRFKTDTDQSDLASLDSEVAAPNIAVTKTLTSAPTDAGDAAEYTVTIANTATGSNATTAFDINLNDLAPGDLNSFSWSNSVVGSGITVTINSDDQTLDADINKLSPGESVTFTLTAEVNDTILAGKEIVNTANVTYTSLQGDFGTGANATGSDLQSLNTNGVLNTTSGSEFGERNGSGGVNDFSDSDSANTTLAMATFSKSVLSTSIADTAGSNVAIGEVVTYAIDFIIPEGQYSRLDLTDVLPAGMTYLNNANTQITAIGGYTGPIPTFTVNEAGNIITFEMAGFTHTGTSSAETGGFRLEYQAVVNDVVGNVGLSGSQTQLTNSATGETDDPNSAGNLSLIVTGNSPATTDTETVTVVEPQLVVSKSGPNEANLGETVSYTVTVQTGNAATQDAYDLTITDTLPSGLTLVQGSVNVVQAPGGAAVNLQVDDTGNAVTITADQLILSTPPQGQLTITYDAVVSAQASVYATDITNTIEAEFDSSPVDNDPNERTTTVDDDSTVSVVGPDIALTKTDGETNAEPGDTLTYTIAVTNKAAPEGSAASARDADNITITDVIPNNTTYVSASGGDSANYNSGTNTVTWTINKITPGNTVNLTLQVLIDDPLPATVDEISNTASATISGIIEPDATDNSATDTTNLNTISDLSVVKTDGQTEVEPGDVITYTITASNLGNQDATGVVVEDTFPTDQLANLSAPSVPGVNSVSINNTTGKVVWNISELKAGESIVLTLNAEVVNAHPEGLDMLVNTVEISDDGTNGVDNNPTNNESTDTNTVTASPDYIITKDDGITTIGPGQSTVYTITVRNIGNQDGKNVEIVDTFPNDVYTNVVASNGGVVDQAAGTVTWNVATLAGGGAETVTFTLSADISNTATSSGDIVNTVTVEDDGSNGPDLNLFNNTATDTNQFISAIPNMPKADQGWFTSLFMDDMDYMAPLVPFNNVYFEYQIIKPGSLSGTEAMGWEYEFQELRVVNYSMLPRFTTALFVQPEANISIITGVDDPIYQANEFSVGVPAVNLGAVKIQYYEELDQDSVYKEGRSKDVETLDNELPEIEGEIPESLPSDSSVGSYVPDFTNQIKRAKGGVTKE